MQDGFLKVSAACPDLLVADCAANAEKIKESLCTAEKDGVRLLVLPELSLTGCTCGDLFAQKTLLDGARRALRSVIEASRGKSLVTVLGLPFERAGKLYDCAAVIHDGALLGLVPKTHLSSNGESNQTRHFAPAPAENTDVPYEGSFVPFGSRLIFRCEEMPSFAFAVELCEDLRAPVPPSALHAVAGALIIANPAASGEIVGRAERRRLLAASQSLRLCCGYIYAEAGSGESTTDLVYAGNHLLAENGLILEESAPFSGSTAVTEFDLEKLQNARKEAFFPEEEAEGYTFVPFSVTPAETKLTRRISRSPFIPDDGAACAARSEQILDIQAHGLAKRLAHAHASSAVVGISGGLDSCLALLVTVRALDLLGRPHTDAVAVTMPCFGTTARTKGNAERLCECLGTTLRTVDIWKAAEGHLADIGHDPALRDVTYENAQARERTQVLMDIANQANGLVIGTGDLSELALGWATYNGDHMSMYGVNATVPKTLVRCIVGYAADSCGDDALAAVLRDILATPVSPELLPADGDKIAQKTEDLVGPYELHDFYLYYAVRRGYTPKKILRLAEYAFGGAYPRETLLKWLRSFYRRFFIQQFKRSCLPDGPKVGSVGFSPRGDWKMPSDACSSLWLSEIDALS